MHLCAALDYYDGPLLNTSTTISNQFFYDDKHCQYLAISIVTNIEMKDLNSMFDFRHCIPRVIFAAAIGGQYIFNNYLSEKLHVYTINKYKVPNLKAREGTFHCT